MGYQMILQPDGEKIAVWSSYSGTWQAWDLDRAGAKAWLAGQEAEGLPVDWAKADRYIGYVLDGHPEKAYGANLALTFAEAQAHSQHHGGEVLDGPVCPDLLAVLEAPFEDALAG